MVFLYQQQTMRITFVFQTRQTSLCAVFVWRAFNPTKEWNGPKRTKLKKLWKKTRPVQMIGRIAFCHNVSHIPCYTYIMHASNSLQTFTRRNNFTWHETVIRLDIAAAAAAVAHDIVTEFSFDSLIRLSFWQVHCVLLLFLTFNLCRFGRCCCHNAANWAVASRCMPK